MHDLANVPGLSVRTSEADMSIKRYASTRWAGSLCVFAGLNAAPEHLEGDVTDQANDVFKQVRSILADEGLTLKDVVSVTGYLNDPRDFVSYDEVWRETFPVDPPTRTTVAAQLLVPGARLEVSVTAARNPVETVRPL